MGTEQTKVVSIVSYVLLLMMFSLLLAVLGKWLFTSSIDQNLLIMVAQSIISMCTAVAGYYLGSSDGSRKKDEALKLQLLQEPATLTKGVVK